MRIDPSIPGVVLHPTMKPIPLLKRWIEITTDPGHTVFDPCAGGGSTLIAAHLLGRSWYGTELSPNRFTYPVKIM